jgi:hypothetical protein
MQQLYQNKQALNFNGKSMYLKLYLDIRNKENNLNLVFNQTLHDSTLKEKAKLRGENIYWENLPTNIVGRKSQKSKRTSKSQMAHRRF